MFIDREKYILLLADALQFQAIVTSKVDLWEMFSTDFKEYINEFNKDLNTNFNNYMNLAEYLIDNDKV